MLFLRRIFSYNFKDKIFIYYFFEFRVCRRTCRYLCLIICDKRYFIHSNYHVFTIKTKETKGDVLIEFWNIRKKVQWGDKSNVKVSRSVKGATFTKKIRYWFVSCDLSCLCLHPRQFSDVSINCLNNDLLRYWLDLRNSCLLDFLKTSSSLVLAVSWTHFWGVFQMYF